MILVNSGGKGWDIVGDMSGRQWKIMSKLTPHSHQKYIHIYLKRALYITNVRIKTGHVKTCER